MSYNEKPGCEAADIAQFPSQPRGVPQVVAASPVGAGQEIHNTYGELSNCELVQKVRTPRIVCLHVGRSTLALETLHRIVLLPA